VGLASATVIARTMSVNLKTHIEAKQIQQRLNDPMLISMSAGVVRIGIEILSNVDRVHENELYVQV